MNWATLAYIYTKFAANDNLQNHAKKPAHTQAPSNNGNMKKSHKTLNFGQNFMYSAYFSLTCTYSQQKDDDEQQKRTTKKSNAFCLCLACVC